MQTKIKNWLLKFDELPLRFRLIITLGVVFIIFSIIDLSWLSTTSKAITLKEGEISRVQSITQELIESQNQQNQDTYSQRNNPKIIRLAKLEEQLKKVRDSLKDHTLNLVQPEDMANLLKNIIQSVDSLKLQSLRKRKAMPLSDSKLEKPHHNDSIKLFRHTLEIDLIGSYQATYKFLQKLENLDKTVAFDNFEYTVTDYPSGQIKLLLSTLSLQEEWIGG